jgi:hypothetical protein
VSEAWHPNTLEGFCKRNAGRRKLHMRRRAARADRIVRLLRAMEAAPELRESAYGWLRETAETMQTSRASASRDLALARRIQGQFARMFGRPFNPTQDRVKWSWDWSSYGFVTRESIRSGHKRPVGKFAFNTRSKPTDEEFCGFGPASWYGAKSLSARDIISALRFGIRA